MKAKKGISLIVLVITIIVIIILAAAVLLTLNQNNPIDNANTAVTANDKAEIKSALSLFVTNYMSKTNGLSPFAADEDEVTITDSATEAIVDFGTLTPETASSSAGQVTNISFKDLGIKSSKIKSATYNPSNGTFEFELVDSTTEE